MNFKTEQEQFWMEEEWATSYMIRKGFDKISIKPYENFFSRIIKDYYNIKSIVEFGANIGLNLVALKNLFPSVSLSAVEINPKACEQLLNLGFINKIYNQSLLDLNIDQKSDLVLIKTVLIHINPNHLELVYKNIYETSNKYILIAEYYNPKPIEVEYRGHSNKLFKRDFAGEMLNMYNNLKLIDYGFAYHKDTNLEQDDINWFLLEKIS
ncbi:pseudaminic acid biosynthesis-associated methylase [Aliarcobacter cryaerophilus]|uniref:pseudaminic acid biosynthesis-associated methylase n=1 Tax=Aliarcobacter cryaerophilus TaxID=28198 RepID=UPI003DA5535C